MSWKESPCPELATCPYILPDLPPGDNINKPNVCASVIGTIPGRSRNAIPEDYYESAGKKYPRSRPITHYRTSYSTGRTVAMRDMQQPGATLFRRKGGCNKETCGRPIVSAYLVKHNSDRTCTYKDARTGDTTCFARNAQRSVANGTTSSARMFNSSSVYNITTDGYLFSRGKTYRQLAVPLGPGSDGPSPEVSFNTAYQRVIPCPSRDEGSASGSNLLRTFYKPSNPQFSANTAVSSGARTARTKSDAILANYFTQHAVPSPSMASELAYGLDPEHVYTLGEKPSECTLRRKPTGGRTQCPTRETETVSYSHASQKSGRQEGCVSQGDLVAKIDEAHRAVMGAPSAVQAKLDAYTASLEGLKETIVSTCSIIMSQANALSATAFCEMVATVRSDHAKLKKHLPAIGGYTFEKTELTDSLLADLRSTSVTGCNRDMLLGVRREQDDIKETMTALEAELQRTGELRHEESLSAVESAILGTLYMTSRSLDPADADSAIKAICIHLTARVFDPESAVPLEGVRLSLMGQCLALVHVNAAALVHDGHSIRAFLEQPDTAADLLLDIKVPHTPGEMRILLFRQRLGAGVHSEGYYVAGMYPKNDPDDPSEWKAIVVGPHDSSGWKVSEHCVPITTNQDSIHLGWFCPQMVRNGTNALPSFSRFAKHGTTEKDAEVTDYVRSDSTVIVLTHEEGCQDVLSAIKSLQVITETASFLFQDFGL